MIGLFSRGAVCKGILFQPFHTTLPACESSFQKNNERDVFVENLRLTQCLESLFANWRKDLYNYLAQYCFNDIIQYFVVALLHKRESRYGVSLAMNFYINLFME